MNTTPVVIDRNGVKVLALAKRGSLLGNPVTHYYTHDGVQVYALPGRVTQCPVFGPEPHREFYTCSCGFRRVRGSAPEGVHARCGS